VLVDFLFDYLCSRCALPRRNVNPALLNDYLGSGARGSPLALSGLLPKRNPPLKKGPQRTPRNEDR
jgi:hypothetical protein